MLRYVALIANSESKDSFDELARFLARRYVGWRCALDGRRAKVWVTAPSQSPIGFTARGQAGCLIGVELGDRQQAPWDSAAGQGLLSRSWGAYIAIQTEDGPNVTITRDPSGRIECYSSRLLGADVYFSHVDDVPEATAAVDPIDWDYIWFHLNAGGPYGRQTGVKGVQELLPGRQIRYDGVLARECSAWPVADIIAARFDSPKSAQTALRAAVAESVGGWARRYDRIALDLSGGFDSAVVLGLIREQAPQARVIGINYQSAYPDGDESAYAKTAADRHGIELLVEPLSAFGQVFDVDQAGRWLRPSSEILPLGVQEARTRAARTVDAQATFSGVGGDQVFGQELPPSVLTEAIQDRLPLRRILGVARAYAKMSSDTFWNIGWNAIKDLLGPQRALSSFIQTPNSYVLLEGHENVNLLSFAHPGILELGSNISLAKFYQLLMFYGVSNCYWRHSPAFKPDEVNPLLSQLVLEASLRIPSYWMNTAGRRRGLARSAFRDVVPTMILERRCKSTIGTHATQVLRNSMNFLRELMLDGELVRRGYLDKNKLELSLSSGLSFQPHFGEISKLISTEMWIQHYKSRYSTVI